MHDYPPEYDQENLDNTYLAEAFPDADSPAELYRQVYKWTACGAYCFHRLRLRACRHHRKDQKREAQHMRGFIFYRGRSPIDNAPIVGIATLESKNGKTGNMVQTWILRTDTHPLEARRTGADRAYCGDCPMHSECYIEWGKAPANVWKTFARGGYMDLRRKPALMRRIILGRMVRLGAAGDPAMIPLQYWLRLLETAKGWTGYTHQWREPWAQPMRELAMASVETAADADLARAMGWRTFRVKTKAQPIAKHEIECPADKGRQCIDCGACDGALKPSAASVVIVVHGPKAKAFERAHA